MAQYTRNKRRKAQAWRESRANPVPIEETWVWKGRTYTEFYGRLSVRYQPKNSNHVFWLFLPYNKKVVNLEHKSVDRTERA